MLFVFTGTDRELIAQSADQLTAGLQKKQPDAELIEVTSDSAESLENELMPLINDQGLFYSKSIIAIARLFPDKDIEKVMQGLLSRLQQTPSIIIWREPELSKTWITRIEKSGATVTVHGDEKAAGSNFKIFDIADALLKGDRPTLWRLLKEAQSEDVEAEGVFGSCWWQLKTLVLAKTYDNADQAGIKAFSFNKAKRSKYNLGQSKLLLADLLLCQNRSRQPGGHSLWVELEDFALSLK